MGTSNIEWTDETWNPVTGCSKVSPGCAKCYAETVALRFWPKQYPQIRYTDESGSSDNRDRRFTDVQWHEDRLNQPLRWKKPRKVFVNSMSDLFHEDVPDAFIDSVFAVMALCPQHTFQVLTKRADRMRAYFDRGAGLRLEKKLHDRMSSVEYVRWPLPNVWLGVSVENQHFVDDRIPLLLQTPATVRFVSYEPALEPVTFLHIPSYLSDQVVDALTGDAWSVDDDVWLGKADRPRLDWVIVGGESGPGARPFDVQWARSVVHQCRTAGVPVFVKQLGANPTGWWSNELGPRVKAFTDRKGGDIDEWPLDLRVREFPRLA